MAAPRDPYADLPNLDPSRSAAEHLNALIDDGGVHDDIVIVDAKLQDKVREEQVAMESDTKNQFAVPEQVVVTAQEARTGPRLLTAEATRDNIRLLICTRNITMRQLGSLAQKRLLELGALFAEIHVIILNEAGEETVQTVRLADNIWLYSTESTSWWKAAYDAYVLANEQLVFAGGFRADVVIAEDPFESAVAGHFIAKKHNRTLQVHILEDIFDPQFKDADEHNGLRLFALPHVLERAACVRVSREQIRARLVAEHPELTPHTEVLPLYYNLESWRDMTPTVNLKERYPQFKFIILHISGMQARSHTVEVINGVAPLLHMYPTLGLVIVGNGPYRGALEKHVIALGIHPQVEFEPVPDEVISHMKTANVLVHLSEDPDEDTVILEAATVKLPIIASTQNIAGTLFQNGDSAFLCNGADPACVSYHLKAFLNDNMARTQFGITAQEIVFDRIEQDYQAYLQAYQSSIERCV